MFYEKFTTSYLIFLFCYAFMLIFKIICVFQEKNSIILNRVIYTKLTTTFVSVFMRILSNISSVVIFTGYLLHTTLYHLYIAIFY